MSLSYSDCRSVECPHNQLLFALSHNLCSTPTAFRVSSSRWTNTQILKKHIFARRREHFHLSAIVHRFKRRVVGFNIYEKMCRKGGPRATAQVRRPLRWWWSRGKAARNGKLSLEEKREAYTRKANTDSPRFAKSEHPPHILHVQIVHPSPRSRD